MHVFAFQTVLSDSVEAVTQILSAEVVREVIDLVDLIDFVHITDMAPRPFTCVMVAEARGRA